MNCHKCGKEIDGQEYKMVAEWSFCTDCFGGLLNKPSPKPEPEPIVENTIECYVCKRKIEDENFRKMGIWTFCPECYDTMMPAPAPEKTESSDKKNSEEDEHRVSVRMVADMVKRVNCQGCGRQIPEKGGKAADGKIFCPDCYYALSAENKQSAGSGTVYSCDSCCRKVPESSLKSIEGFLICSACMATDSELSVHLARSRHLKLLQQIRSATPA
jgi:formylmethanofuran dehydrogenase subunit E